MKDWGKRAAVVTIAGYVVLFSYTWPLGFAPLVSVESLPILLVGTALLLLLIQIIQAIFTAPFTWLINPEILEQLFKVKVGGHCWNKHMIVGPEFRPPFRKVLGQSADLIGRSGVAFVLFQLSLLYVFVFMAWFRYASTLDQPGMAVIHAFLFVFGFNAISGLIVANTWRAAILPILGVTFIFVLLPMFQSGKDGQISDVAPNPLIAKALRSIGAGGGLLFTFESDNSTARKVGRLYYYDGTRAWYRECGDAPGVVGIGEIHSLRIYPKNTSPKEAGCTEVKDPAEGTWFF